MAHPAHLVACGFGSGLSPKAPGTVGTLFAWMSFPLLSGHFSDLELLVFLLPAVIGGAAAAHKTGVDLGVIDHGSIVWDEIVAFWLVLLLCPAHWGWQTAAFILFRYFDIRKPPPARYFDERVKNGLGVMCDDLVAAGYALMILALARFISSFIST
ncbi:MAG TPA: phosphatidylglycerophosphatase A [Accumulibacter sp.]|nr:phosphatidylglycerophosphatase A [Accumulibacter sp.]HMW17396.1 phosphatidylglycerophosphatase A [Accumulibacter sp.]HNC17833.1 phosphatidylglycerophosphatase A [Accumulibacter sp.]HND80122.1 phosphatidylglycerophosphatase A [Accumulibacter sp.]HNE12839.1 phosphatidylglycerophosphatase A [Accumulibacter sp.]